MSKDKKRIFSDNEPKPKATIKQYLIAGASGNHYQKLTDIYAMASKQFFWCAHE
jgi:hypothetical protein